MRIDFTSQSAVVTGGANGIGLAVAKSLASAGAAVSILDLPAENPAAVAASFGGQGYAADVTDRQSLETAFDRCANPDVAVIGAGIGSQSSLLATSDETWHRMLAVNLTGAFYSLQIAARKMKSKGGAIVLVASTNSYDGEPLLAAYNATKAGLLGLLHTAANELGPYGIRVNAVCPGLIRTRLTAAHFSNPETLATYFRQIPLGRGGEPGEVAAAVAFLASGLASYITGAALLVDGGQMASKFGTWSGEEASFDGQQWRRTPSME